MGIRFIVLGRVSYTKQKFIHFESQELFDKSVASAGKRGNLRKAVGVPNKMPLACEAKFGTPTTNLIYLALRLGV